MAMPSARGLFHRSIAQSGSAIRGQSADDATDGAERFLAKLGIAKNQLERIQQIDWREIQTAFYGEPRIARLGNGPVIDGTIIPRHQWDPTAPSYSANVPFMMGSVENENGWVGPPPYELPDDEMLQLFTTRLAATTRRKRRSCSRSTSAGIPRRATACCGSWPTPTTRGAGTRSCSAG